MNNSIIFPSASSIRPILLCEETRSLAARALNAEFGKEIASQSKAVEMDDIPGFSDFSELEKHKYALRRIAETAPIRLVSPKLAGSATFDMARTHHIPAVYAGESFAYSVSHITPGYERILKKGFSGLEADIKKRLTGQTTNDQKSYLEGLLHTVDSVRIFHKRTLEYVAVQGSTDLYDVLKNVPEHPAKTFHEALQSLWFSFAVHRLFGNWPAIGRIDLMLGPYLEKDLAEGSISINEARELLAHFFICGCEWITGWFEWGSGDAQHYQNIVLSGVDDAGNFVYNTVTDLVLDIVDELPISDFPIAVRINDETPENLLLKIADVTRHGGGVVAVYNDDVCIKAMEHAGYHLNEARSYANDGCWEIQVPGATNFGYFPVDTLLLFNRDVLRSHDSYDALIPKYNTPEELIEVLKESLRYWRDNEFDPTGTFMSSVSLSIDLTIDDCIERASGYSHTGPKYKVKSVHAGGLPDVANSISAIKKMVFEDKLISLDELIMALRMNWEGYEHIRRFAQTRTPFYGNDNDHADDIFVKVYNAFCDVIEERPVIDSVMITPGISTFGREIEWRDMRGATAFGTFTGEILSGNIDPTPGTDETGATAVIRSACKPDFTRLSGSTALQIRLLPLTINGDKGSEVIASLIRGFVSEGGFFLQFDVCNREILLKAKENPEAYKNLSVRVSGWSARFVTLNEKWQDMVIAKYG